MAKKKSKVAPKRVEIKLPLPADFVAEELVVVPVPVDRAEVKPLLEEVGPTRCIATLFHGWSGDYIVLSAMDGQSLPLISENGTRVDVSFLPPLG